MSDDLSRTYSICREALHLYDSLLAACEAAANGHVARLSLHVRALAQRLELVNQLYCSGFVEDAFASEAALKDITHAALQLETHVLHGSRSYATTHQFAIALAYDVGTHLALTHAVDTPFIFESVTADQIIAHAAELAQLRQPLAEDIAAVGGMYHVRMRLQQEFVTASRIRADRLPAANGKAADDQGTAAKRDCPAQSVGRMNVRELAEKHGVDREKLRRRLERWRRTAPAGWFEDEDPIKNQPRYFYDEVAVLGVIQELTRAGA